MKTTVSEPTTIVFQKLRSLSPEKLQEVEIFIDLLYQRDEDRQLVQAAMRNSEAVFKQVWDNEEDAEYDQL